RLTCARRPTGRAVPRARAPSATRCAGLATWAKFPCRQARKVDTRPGGLLSSEKTSNGSSRTRRGPAAERHGRGPAGAGLLACRPRPVREARRGWPERISALVRSVPLRGGLLKAASPPPLQRFHTGRFTVEAAGATDVGLHRDHNEDALGLFPAAYEAA